MFLILVILSFAALVILSSPLFKTETDGCIIWGAIIVVSIILAIIGTGAECRDGWDSSSIGSQGACSWHGGVVTRFTDFGKTTLKVSLLIIARKVFRVWLDNKSK